MLNRRHLRIKALQSIYAWQMSENKDVNSGQKQLMNSIDSVYEMYISMLALIIDVTEYTAVDAIERSNKHLPTAEDLNPNQKLLNNAFAQVLKQNPDFVAYVNKYQINWHADPEIVKSIFNSLKDTKEYQAYLEEPAEDLESSKEIIKFIFRKKILKDPIVLQTYEDKFINWPVDSEVMKGMIAKTIKNFTSTDPFQNKLTPLCIDWEEDSRFVKDLFQYTVKNEDKYQGYIADRTKNWESERIAVLDTILMKMAISEMMNFPSIPVKVTINEYLELSKDYSTPKSNTFINGILDKILNDLKKNNSIKKTGRGLID